MDKNKTRESVTKEIVDLFYKEGPLTNKDLEALQKSTKELCAIPEPSEKEKNGKTQ